MTGLKKLASAKHNSTSIQSKLLKIAGLFQKSKKKSIVILIFVRAWKKCRHYQPRKTGFYDITN